MNLGGIAQGLGKIGSGIFGLSNNKNPADEANQYISQIPGQANQYNMPYWDYGRRQLPNLENEYNLAIHNPGERYNQIGESFQQSPGFKFAMQQALQGAGHAAGVNGMYGSPEHEQQNMQLATDLANQDYYNYMNGATDLYKTGLGGAQGIMNTGANAGNNMADMIAAALAQQGSNAAIGQMQKNQNQSGALSNIVSGLGNLFF